MLKGVKVLKVYIIIFAILFLKVLKVYIIIFAIFF